MDFGRLIIWSLLLIYFSIRFIKHKGLSNLYFDLMGLYGLTLLNFILVRYRTHEIINFLDSVAMKVVNTSIAISLVIIVLMIIKKEFVSKA